MVLFLRLTLDCEIHMIPRRVLHLVAMTQTAEQRKGALACLLRGGGAPLNGLSTPLHSDFCRAASSSRFMQHSS